MDFAPSYPCYTAERSCFDKRFPQTVSDSPENPLHRHSHSWSYHSHSSTKRTLGNIFFPLPVSRNLPVTQLPPLKSLEELQQVG
jgi:hypothetical protein